MITRDLPTLSDLATSLDHLETSGELSQVRSYLASVSCLPYELPEGTKKELVDEFVAARQKDPSFGAEEFQVQLTVRGGERAQGERAQLPGSNGVEESVV